MHGVDLRGKTAIVTGGYSGLGRETVRVFLAAGARVVVPARDVARARRALADLPAAEVQPMDLLDPVSIDAFAAKFSQSNDAVHLLINSAGIMAGPLMRDARGYEAQFATNHLGHFQLTVRLWPALARAQSARVVSVSSMGHRYSPVVFDDPNFRERPYDPFQAYGQSKTANILFAVELDRRGEADGIRAFSIHPGGIVDTGLGKHVSLEALRTAGAIDAAGRPIIDPAKGLKNVEQGTATQVWCATSPQLKGLGGVYCENSDIAPMWNEDGTESYAVGDSLMKRGVRAYAIEADSAQHLWQLSEALVGLPRTRT